VRAEKQTQPRPACGVPRHREGIGDPRRSPGCRRIGRGTHVRRSRGAAHQLLAFAADDMLTEVVTKRVLAGVATGRHAGTAEPVDTQVDKEANSTSGSAISRRFVRQTETALES
jgi:hypothetical protein